MKIELTGDALKLLEDFIARATSIDTAEELAEAMYYDPDELCRRARLLRKRMETAK